MTIETVHVKTYLVQCLTFSKSTGEFFWVLFFLLLLGVVAIMFLVTMDYWLPSELLPIDPEDEMWEKSCRQQSIMVSYFILHVEGQS